MRTQARYAGKPPTYVRDGVQHEGAPLENRARGDRVDGEQAWTRRTTYVRAPTRTQDEDEGEDDDDDDNDDDDDDDKRAPHEAPQNARAGIQVAPFERKKEKHGGENNGALNA